MSNPRVIDVGNCPPDYAAIKRMLETRFQAKVEQAHSADDAVQLLKSAPADLVLINLVLEHIEDIELVLRHALFVMQKGAQVIITEYHPDRLAGGTGAQIENESEVIEISNFWHPIEEYVEIADKIGLQIKSIDQWPQGFFDDPKQNLENARPLILSLQLEKEGN